MLKRIKWIMIPVIVMLAFFSSALAENLLENGSFEELDESGLPIAWEVDSYRRINADTRFSVETDAYEGEHCAMIVSGDMNDARFAQTIEVKPSTLYRLSGYLMVQDLPDVGIGANLSAKEDHSLMEGIFNTNGEWEEFVVYGETGEDQTEVTIYARLGGYSGESSGSVAFDNLSLVEVDAVPGDDVAKLWYASKIVYSEPEHSVELDPIKDKEPNTWFLILTAVLFITLFLALLPKLTNEHDKGKQTATFVIGLVISVVLRLVIGYFVRGYEVDINCFLSWSGTLFRTPFDEFYSTVSFCDYVPGYLPVLGFNGWLFSIADSRWHVLIIKLVPILCDALGAFVLFSIGGKATRTSKAVLVLSLLYAFNPAAIMNSAAWGQMDSVMALMLLMVVNRALRHNWAVAIPLFFVAVLVKPQALMFGPLGLAALIMDIVQDRKRIAKAFIGLGVGILVAIIMVVPFTGEQAGGWIFEKYGETLASYPRVTLNTANFYYLLGLNWAELENKVPMQTVLWMSATLLAFGLTLILRGKNRTSGKMMIGVISAVAAVLLVAFGHHNYEILGYLMMGLIIAVALYQYVLGKDIKNLPLAGGNLLLFLYVFGTKMHERYIFSALLLYSLAFIINKDWRILAVFVTISVTSFVNCGIILDNSMRLGSSSGHLLLENVGIGSVLASINILAACLSYWVCNDLMVLNKEPIRLDTAKISSVNPIPMPMNTADTALLQPKDSRLHMQKKDYAIMLIVTALYSVLVLCNLGSLKAPQTTYEAKEPTDEIVFDLGEMSTFRMLYYAQVSYSNFDVYVSDDGANWSEAYLAEMAQGQCYRWKYLCGHTGSGAEAKFDSTARVELEGRFVKISPINTSQDRALKLNEVIFRDLEGNRISAKAVTESATVLLDEQDTLTGEPSWYNSTYFDEIYHARTAYEHANGIFPYETTHPPLGKVIMSWFVLLFGMTPFVWRFAGALMGILMLPAMYLFGKQLFKKTAYATVTMLLMTLDCMHLTQTRIATIDSFPVFFIIMAYFFMLRYMQTDVWKKGLLKSCVPLLFSGIFMGLSIASKWIGIYAGIGLAALFFYTSVQHLRQYRAAQKYDIVEQERRGAVARAKYYGLSQVALTWLLCIVFFIAIPLVIYYLSYIPYFASTGGVTVEKVIEAAIGYDYGNGIRQGGMLGYHATPNLGMDHPYYSPWYEWPFILKPMWYASDSFMPKGFAYSIFCIGNPAVWFAGIVAMAFVAYYWAKRHIYNTGSGLTVHLRANDSNIAYAFILIAFLSQYLPWVVVPRGTYIYHYFASVPFIILATVAVLRLLSEKFGPKGEYIMWGFVVLCAVCFIMLYPYASGITVPESWLELGKKLMLRPNSIYY